MTAGTALWADRPWAPRSDAPPPRTGVLVVGGGITGLVAAIDLVARGVAVTVLEAGAAGSGASGRAFGSIALGCTATPGALTARHGAERALRMWRESSDAAGVFAGYLAELGLDAGFHRAGHVRVAVHRGQEEDIRAQYRQWRRLLPQEELRLAGGDELAAEFPGAGFRLGLVDERSASVDPYRLLGGLVAHFQERGGVYVEHARAEKILRQGNGFTVRHPAGETTAEHVVVATNGHTDGLLPRLGRRVYPVGSYMIATAALPPDSRAALSRRTVTTAHVRKNYFRLTGEGRLVYGGRLNLATGLTPAQVKTRLHNSMLGYFPALADVEVTHAWGGRLGFTFDQVPHLGTDDGVHYAVGYCGRGLPMAVHLGRQVARRVLGLPVETTFADTPFPTRWYFRRTPWFLPPTATAHRLRDLARRR
ncbi:FAD-binding oxidoreductase [Actinosynnema sp. NPDC047251]|uniref:Putative FAD dependent oxidoreductase n=1 Tax=Saccharothrix espanaensis (strain ATCC 51144 / DSM 44229 / JCM 9112 / NBRC 15066 / NRRL 15764) TaxID=1179773 RepID=K0K229_SACES|nr:FAD-binding oxidoreductase [Saccharothrix espanaensis]CCH32406.1 putative FAD dependent oxidoreductase [Saccharothrix espanaensis DSM 44229]